MNHSLSSAGDLADWNRDYPNFTDGPHARPVLSIDGGWRAIAIVIGLLGSLLALALLISI